MNIYDYAERILFRQSREVNVTLNATCFSLFSPSMISVKQSFAFTIKHSRSVKLRERKEGEEENAFSRYQPRLRKELSPSLSHKPCRNISNIIFLQATHVPLFTLLTACLKAIKKLRPPIPPPASAKEIIF